MNKINRVLVTGARGFVGNQVFIMLSKTKQVIGQGRVNDIVSDNFFNINIDSQTDWHECLDGVDGIVHLAGIAHNKSDDPNYIFDVNVKGTINLALQAVESGVKRFIYISSIGVLGNSTKIGKPFDEKTVNHPHSLYAKSKLSAENELLKIAIETDLEVVIIRPVLVYGASAPGNFGKLVNLVSKVSILPFALCDNKRSFISVENLANFISVCIEHPKAKNEIFCISEDEDISIKEITCKIAKGLDKNLIQVPLPKFIFNVIGRITGKQDQVEQLIGDLQVDSSKAKKLLDWIPPYTMHDTFSRLTRST